MDTLLDGISLTVKQKIYECILQAICEDRQEAASYLGLRTNVSGSFLTWDLIYRNLINTFGDDNVKYSATVHGMWTVLLLHDVESGLLISFMRDTRLKTIQRLTKENQPKYIRSLIALNNELQAPIKQQTLFYDSAEQNDYQLAKTLEELCANFESPVECKNLHHAMVCFSGKYGGLTSLNAYIFDSDLDVVCEQNWLDIIKPVMSNEIEQAEIKQSHSAITLKPKATARLKEKELVALKVLENEKKA